YLRSARVRHDDAQLPCLGRDLFYCVSLRLRMNAGTSRSSCSKLPFTRLGSSEVSRSGVVRRGSGGKEAARAEICETMCGATSTLGAAAMARSCWASASGVAWLNDPALRVLEMAAAAEWTRSFRDGGSAGKPVAMTVILTSA